MAIITDTIYNRLTAGMEVRRRDIIISNFLGGLAWGFGTVIGAGALVAIIVYVLKAIGVFSFLAPFFTKASGG